MHKHLAEQKILDTRVPTGYLLVRNHQRLHVNAIEVKTYAMGRQTPASQSRCARAQLYSASSQSDAAYHLICRNDIYYVK